jgi:hypothetical protein
LAARRHRFGRDTRGRKSHLISATRLPHAIAASMSQRLSLSGSSMFEHRLGLFVDLTASA